MRERKLINYSYVDEENYDEDEIGEGISRVKDLNYSVVNSTPNKYNL